MTEILEKTAVVIPVFNNSATLRDVAERTLRQNCARVIVVDDGCTDCEIRKVLENLQITLLQHEKNLGKGEALKTAACRLTDAIKSELYTCRR